MWYEFRITVEGEIEAQNEAEARMMLRATVRRLGSLDIEELTAIGDDDEVAVGDRAGAEKGEADGPAAMD